jgi:hypothetical protein
LAEVLNCQADYESEQEEKKKEKTVVFVACHTHSLAVGQH